MTESRSVIPWVGGTVKKYKETRRIMEIFSISTVGVVLQVCTPVKPIGLCALNGCSLLYLNSTAVLERQYEEVGAATVS